MRSRVPWVVTGTGLALIVPTIMLAIRNRSLDDDPFFIPIALVVLTGWATVGATLASRNPSNPIGWLMMTFGLGFLLAGLTSELAMYTYVTVPGAIPSGALGVDRELDLHRGRHADPRTPASVPDRYRPDQAVAPAAVGVDRRGRSRDRVDRPPNRSIYAGQLRVPNPTGVPALNAAAAITQTIVGFGYVLVLAPLCILAVILRFRRSRGIERQQIRWLVYVALISGLALAVAIASSLGLRATRRTP